MYIYIYYAYIVLEMESLTKHILGEHDPRFTNAAVHLIIEIVGMHARAIVLNSSPTLFKRRISE